MLSINANDVSSLSMNANSQIKNANLSGVKDTSKTEDEEEMKASKPAMPENTVAVNEDGDTLQVSEEGAKMQGEMQQGGAISEASAEIVTEAESEESSQDLSSYSESELKQMLEDGDITQAEYNAEIASRKADEMQQEMLEKQTDVTKNIEE